MSDSIGIPVQPSVGIRINGTLCRARLVFNPRLQPQLRQNFQMTQQFIDSEVLRLSDPYVPFDTGYLKKSGILGTVIGSGDIFYIAPYGRKQYYESKVLTNTPLQYDTSRHPLAGKLWFERMKADHIDDIRKGAAAIAARRLGQ